MIWFTFVELIRVAHHSFLTFSLPSFDFSLIFPTIYSFFRAILTLLHLPVSTPFFTPITWFVDGLTTFHLFSFHHRHSHWLLLSSHAHEILLCFVHYTRGYEFDHWVFEPSFLSFLYLFTLAYVTSRVLRLPWGHEIIHYLWLSSLGQAFVDWLKYSRYYVFSYERYFWKHLVSLSYLAYWCLMDFFKFGDSSLMISDSSNCCASDIHIGAYFPFSLRFLVVVERYGYPYLWL